MKKLLFLLGLSSLMQAHQFEYVVQMDFKRGPTPDSARHKIIVNNEVLLCKCGRKPVFLLFVYGTPEAFCYKHLPLKEEQPQMNFDSMASTAEGNENGASN